MTDFAIILLTLSCPQVKMVNVSGYPWNSYDRKELRYARKRCGEIYPDAKCVKLFRKFGKRDFTVICGAEENK